MDLWRDEGNRGFMKLEDTILTKIPPQYRHGGQSAI